MPDLWAKEKEIEFFKKSRNFATPEQLFYVSDDNRYFAYWPKNYEGEKSTLQSRNSLIGTYTEKYSVDLLQEYASSKGWYAVQSVVCEDIGLTSRSPADVAFCKTKSTIQTPRDIFAIFEVKMSIVWNWELINPGSNERLSCLGDYKSHQGNPGLLRSDSILKAIGKSINIRVSDFKSSHIPIIILGNTPITESYYHKVDYLKNAGIIQGFWSCNPKPLDNNNNDNIKATNGHGFIRMDTYSELVKNLKILFSESRVFFSSMKTKKELGKIIEISNREDDIILKAEKFLSLIRE